MFKPNTQFEILTPTGFQDFDGISMISRDRGICITFCDASQLWCSLDHALIDINNNEITAKSVKFNHKFNINGNIIWACKVQLIEKPTTFYDPINVSNGNVYISNNVISHNCEFLSNDPLLISTVTLAYLTNLAKTVKPVGTIGEILFYKQPISSSTYLVGVDPATGNGKDFSVIEVFEFPSMEQVAEWRNNTTSSVTSYSILTKLLRVLERTGSTVYFSCENNGIGEGIIALFEADENPPANSEFISEDGANRSGMTTTGKTKLKACMALKEILEKGTLQINSLILVEELKSFVRRGTTWDHKPGATSDCVSAVLIIMRILEGIASYDQEAYDLLTAGAYQSTLGEDGEWDEQDVPMEFLI